MSTTKKAGEKFVEKDEKGITSILFLHDPKAIKARKDSIAKKAKEAQEAEAKETEEK